MSSTLPYFNINKELSINNGGQNHLLIEGDNEHVLKAMQYTHKNSIDFIYIDPPYNTDADVPYRDGWERTDWINFIKIRIQLAHTLLKESGAISVSIDDHSGMQPYLEIILNEVFGNVNRMPKQIWQGKSLGKDPKKIHIVEQHEYILSYAKSINHFNSSDLMRKTTDKDFPKVDEATGNRYRIVDLRKAGADSLRTDSPSMYYSVIDPDGNEHFPIRADGKEGRWHWGKSHMQEEVASGDNLLWTKTKTGGWKLNYKRWADPEKVAGHRTIITYPDTEECGRRCKPVGPSGEGAKRLDALIGSTEDGAKLFPFPKPISLMKYIIDWGTNGNPNAVVMDFFVGSGSAADALIDMNAEDGGNRQGIFVTNNEEEEGLIFDNATYPRVKAALTGDWANGKGTPREASLTVLNTNTFEINSDSDHSIMEAMSDKFVALAALKEGAYDVEEHTGYFVCRGVVGGLNKTVLVWADIYDDFGLEDALDSVQPDVAYLACESLSIFGNLLSRFSTDFKTMPVDFARTIINSDRLIDTVINKSAN